VARFDLDQVVEEIGERLVGHVAQSPIEGEIEDLIQNQRSLEGRVMKGWVRHRATGVDYSEIAIGTSSSQPNQVLPSTADQFDQPVGPDPRGALILVLEIDKAWPTGGKCFQTIRPLR